jgi:two-component system, OmpR family, KDP operon response regulator KdpE
VSVARAPRGNGAARRRPGERPAVLVVEDDPELRRLTRRALELAGYDVQEAADGSTALALASDPALVLVVLDVMLPGLDGVTLCRRLRERSDVSILMITALSREEDIVRGLDAGADDYLGKPFGVDELLARTRAVLRRAAPLRRGARGKYVHGDLTVDLAARRVTVGSRAVALTPTEYALLAALVAAPGRLHTHYELLDRVWRRGDAADRHVLEVTIGRLRRKLEPDPTRPIHVLTSPRAGYLVPRGD